MAAVAHLCGAGLLGCASRLGGLARTVFTSSSSTYSTTPSALYGGGAHVARGMRSVIFGSSKTGSWGSQDGSGAAGLRQGGRVREMKAGTSPIIGVRSMCEYVKVENFLETSFKRLRRSQREGGDFADRNERRGYMKPSRRRVKARKNMIARIAKRKYYERINYLLQKRRAMK